MESVPYSTSGHKRATTGFELPNPMTLNMLSFLHNEDLTCNISAVSNTLLEQCCTLLKNNFFITSKQNKVMDHLSKIKEITDKIECIIVTGDETHYQYDCEFDFFCIPPANIEVGSSRYLISEDKDSGTLESLSKTCSNVKEIVLSNCYKVKYETLLNLVGQNKNLRRLTLTYVYGLDADNIAELIEKCETLEQFVFSNNSNLSNECLLKLAHSCPKLAVLSLVEGTTGWKNNRCFKEIINNCVNLTTLSLSSCSALTNEELKYICNAPKLKSLSFWGLQEMKDGAYMFWGLQQILSQKCKQINMVGINNCLGVNDKIEYLAKMKDLESLVLPNVVNTEGLIKILTKQFKRLQQLSIWDSRNLSDNQLEELTKSCANLKRLNVGLCTSLTNKGIMALTKNCIQLKTLDISECRNLTDCSLNYIALHLEEIENLDISRLTNITQEGIKGVVDNCLRLKFICCSRNEEIKVTSTFLEDLGDTKCVTILIS